MTLKSSFSTFTGRGPSALRSRLVSLQPVRNRLKAIGSARSSKFVRFMGTTSPPEEQPERSAHPMLANESCALSRTKEFAYTGLGLHMPFIEEGASYKRPIFKTSWPIFRLLEAIFPAPVSYLSCISPTLEAVKPRRFCVLRGLL